MTNSCFIIVPSGDPTGYAQGHVGRVYDYLIAPACRKAGYFPTRLDQMTPLDQFDSVKEAVDSDVAIFDLSANNVNALYGLAVRHALGLPFILIKDSKSAVPFHTSELDVIEYDETLRIDTVQKTTDLLSEALTKAVNTKKDKHAMLRQLGIAGGAARLQATDSAPSAAEADASHPAETNAPTAKSLPIISPLPDYVGDPFDGETILKLAPGDELFHLSYGKGKVNSRKKMGKDELANIQFDAGSKLLVLSASHTFRKIKK